MLEACRPILQKGDGVIFIEDGVYYCLDDSLSTLQDKDLNIFSLKEDLNARGLINRSHQDAEIISYHRFVELCCHYSKIVSWF